MMNIGGATAGLLSGAVVEALGFRSFSHYAGLLALLLLAAAAAAWVAARSGPPAPGRLAPLRPVGGGRITRQAIR